MSSSCETSIINKTENWLKNDEINLLIAKKRCPQILENSCLILFVKIEENTYNAICSQKRDKI